MTMLDVLDHGQPISVSFDDLLKYHGRTAIGGVALGYKAMERAFAVLSAGQPPERHAIRIDTAFPGPGARDAFEMVTRAVTGDRYRIVPDLGGPHRLAAPAGHYVFRFSYLDDATELTLRPGHVREEFIELVRRTERTAAETDRLLVLKQDMADRLMSEPAESVYDAERVTLPTPRR